MYLSIIKGFKAQTVLYFVFLIILKINIILHTKFRHMYASPVTEPGFPVVEGGADPWVGATSYVGTLLKFELNKT